MFSRNSRAWTTTAALALVGAVAVLGTAGHAEASATAQRASTQPAPAFDPTIVHLHGNYETALSHPETVHMAGVDYANGNQPKAPAGPIRSATGSCTEPDCPLPYNGGATQLTPHVYLLLWGPHLTHLRG